ncbi:GATA transcription factor 12 [Canna indica]|uniref:GATA transcription factor n=1 Tax=Canna indica TaxID=4628 RepID=A0AAQ3KW45_9LILI|nr:GATA transcription factor 12 [Canna indica]
MEGAEFLHGGYCRPGTPRCAPEKAAGGDHFVVEDLLDFSNEEQEGEGGGWGFDAAAGNSTDDSSTVTAVDCCSNSFSGCEPHFTGDLSFKAFADAGLSGDLCGPHEELAELEWLSNFVEESFSSEDLHKPHLLSGCKPAASTAFVAAKSELSVPAQPSLFLPEATVPAKARSKRSRAAPCSWSSRLLLFSPSMPASSPESELISLPPAAVGKKATKLENNTDLAAPTAAAASAGRRCLHCQVDKTPQWRAGPMGPKTLCNACGVRYKSGRLVPEYRPAASPTFVPSKHSNSHRKVLELRRQKDLQGQQQQLRSGGVAAQHGGDAAEAGGDGFLFRHMGPSFRQVM